MAYKEVTSLDAEVTVALGKKDKKTGKPYPKQAEGYYLGTRTVQNKRGEGKIHFLQTSKGNLGIWGTTDLDRKLGQVAVGAMTRITSTGTKPTPNGDMYTYRVEQDLENTIEVEITASAAEADDSATESSGGYVAETGDEDEDYASESTYEAADADAEDSAQAAALAAAERKAKVEALLRNGKGKTK